MTIIAAILAVALVVVVYLMLRHQRASDVAAATERTELLLSQADQARAWTEERRELLTRIQRPEYVPVAPMPVFQAPESEPDEINLVGTIAEFMGEDQ